MSAGKFIPLGNCKWCLDSFLEVHVIPCNGWESKPLRFQNKLCCFPPKNQTQFLSKMSFCSVFYFLKRHPLWAKGEIQSPVCNWLPPLICTARFLLFSSWDGWFPIDVSLKLSSFFFSASDLSFATYGVSSFCKRDVPVSNVWSPCAGWSLNKLLLSASCA